MTDYVGDTLIYDIYVVDTTSSPITGVVPETHDGHGPTEAHGFHVEEVGGGYYRVTSNPAMEAGTYGVVVEFLDGDDPSHQELSITWDVDPAPVTTYSSILVDQDHGTTLADLRRRVARATRDYRHVVASEGSDTTVGDIFNLVNNTDYYRGAELLCTVGHPDNIGRKRKVVSSRFEGGVITFTPPLNHPVQVGDQFDLFRFGRIPYGMDEYDQAINDAIASAFPANRERVVITITSPFLEATGYIDIPSTLYGIYRVSLSAGDNDWIDYDPVPMGQNVYASGYAIDHARKRLTFGSLTGYADGRGVMIYGYAHPAPLIRDDDRTTTDAEWIVDQAVSSLLQSNLDQTTFAVGQSRANRADQLRGKMVKPPEPNTIWLS